MHSPRRLFSMAALLCVTAFGPLSCGGNNSTIVSIVVRPADPIAVSGSTVLFTATATFSNGMTIAPWQTVTWSSSDTAVASINTSGAATTVAPGTAVITATDIQHPEITSSATLAVTNMPLAALSVSAEKPVILHGTTTQVTAEGIYADGSRNNVTSSMLWVSSNAGVATISNTQGSNGLVTAVAAGTVTITAIDPLTGISAVTIIIVTP